MNIAIGSSGIHVKAQGNMQNPLPKGHVIKLHKHPYPHMTLLLTGRALVTQRQADGSSRTVELRAVSEQLDNKGKLLPGKRYSNFVWVPEDVEHEIEVVKDGTISWCQFAERDPVDGSVAGRRTGWEGAWQS